VKPHLSWETDMDFIEQLFGVSPDGGDGTTELTYIAVAVAIGALFVVRRLLMRRAARSRAR
jgi:hypothetical protein